MAAWNESERKERVKRARRLDLARYNRVRAVCTAGSASTDLDHHAASVVLAVRRGKA